MIARFLGLPTKPHLWIRHSSTIFALSTGLNECGTAIAVVRISGPQTDCVISKLTLKKSKIIENPRKAILSHIRNPNSKDLIDKGIVLWFPKPHSYTGEDCMELHVHGSKATVSALMRALGSIEGVRPAEEGEFTKRAFINGKMSLLEVEALSNLIMSHTDSQRCFFLSAMSGHVDKLYEDWRGKLLHAIAHIEAILNFGEDEVLDQKEVESSKTILLDVKYKIDDFIKHGSQKSEIMKNGVNITILGPTNVGKSTLMNKLCQRDLSIVSSISGTTRDIVENLLDIKGWKVRISDTAGLKESFKTTDAVEIEGIKRAKVRAKNSDVLVLVADSMLILETQQNVFDSIMREVFSKDERSTENCIFVVNKIDLLSYSDMKKLQQLIPQTSYLVSCKTGDNLKELEKIIEEKIEKIYAKGTNDIFINERHQVHLTSCLSNLDSALKNYDLDLSIASHFIRKSVNDIAKITGEITTEDVLDTIFKDFCIGK